MFIKYFALDHCSGGTLTKCNFANEDAPMSGVEGKVVGEETFEKDF